MTWTRNLRGFGLLSFALLSLWRRNVRGSHLTQDTVSGIPLCSSRTGSGKRRRSTGFAGLPRWRHGRSSVNTAGAGLFNTYAASAEAGRLQNQVDVLSHGP